MMFGYDYFDQYAVFEKNPRDYVFDDNLNSRGPIVIIFGTVDYGYWKVVSHSHLAYFVQLPYLGKLLNLKIRRLQTKFSNNLFARIGFQLKFVLYRLTTNVRNVSRVHARTLSVAASTSWQSS